MNNQPRQSTYGCGVGGLGLDTSFSIGRSGLTSFFGEGILGGGSSSAGGGVGGGVGVGDFKSSVSSGEGTSRKASWSWSANFDFVFFCFGLSRSGDFGSFCKRRESGLTQFGFWHRQLNRLLGIICNRGLKHLEHDGLRHTKNKNGSLSEKLAIIRLAVLFKGLQYFRWNDAQRPLQFLSSYKS